MQPAYRIEPLETRVLLAAAIPIKVIDGFEIATIPWKGQQVDMFAGRWVLKLDGYSGALAAQQSRAAQAVARVSRDFVVQQFLADGLFLVSAPKQLLPSQVQATLSRVPGYRHITPDFRYTTDVFPNDPLFGSQWGLHQANNVDIDAPQAWDINTGSASVVIGIADTGLDLNHPDLAPQLWFNPGEIPANGIDDDLNGYVDDVNGYNFFFNNSSPQDDGDHGSHTGGTAAARGNNSVGVSGVSWHSKLMALKIGSGSSISGAAAVAAMAYTYNLKTRINHPVNIRVTNHSWGGPGFDPNMDFYIGLHANANIILTASAGNNNSNNDLNPRYPSGYNKPNIIAVANLTQNNGREPSSNFGATSVDLAAPGTDILSTIRVAAGSYAFFTGTSMAAPHVAGAVAVAYSVVPNAGFQTIVNAILQGTVPVAAFQGITVTGGRLNLNNTLNLLAVPAAPATPDLTAGSDTGQFNNDNITNDNTPTFMGTGVQGQTIRIYANGVQVGQGVVPPTSIWQITTSPLADGVYNITATASNGVGESPHSAPLQVTIDTVGPSVVSSNLSYLTSPHTLPVVFNEEVGWTIDNSDFDVQNLDTPGTVPVTASYNSATMTATLSFTGVPVLPDADYRLTVFSSGIRDVAGNFLAGATNYTSDFFFMMADADHDRRVNLNDFNIMASNFGLSPRHFGQGDFNYDNVVNLLDFNILAARFGSILAGPSALPGGSPFGQTPIKQASVDRMDDPLAALLA